MSDDILQEAFARTRNLSRAELRWIIEREERPADPNDERPSRCVLGRCRRHKHCYRERAARVACPVFADIEARFRS